MDRFLAVMFVLGFSTPASGIVNLEAVCSGGEAEITIRMINSYDGEFVGVVVTRSIVGVCDDQVVVTSEPIPLPPPAAVESGNVEYAFVTVPAALSNVVYRFEAKLVKSSGDISQVPGGVWALYPPLIPVDYAADGDAVTMRGQLSWGPSGLANYVSIYIIPCDEGCWGDPVPRLVSEMEPFDSQLFFDAIANKTADVLGLPIEFDGMPQIGGDFNVTDIRLTADGDCSPVSNEQVSWGSLKAEYR